MTAHLGRGGHFLFLQTAHSSVLHLLPGKDLATCKLSTATEIAKNVFSPFYLPQAAVVETVLEPLQLVLYILAENADVTRQ